MRVWLYGCLVFLGLGRLWLEGPIWFTAGVLCLIVGGSLGISAARRERR